MRRGKYAKLDAPVDDDVETPMRFSYESNGTLEDLEEHDPLAFDSKLKRKKSAGDLKVRKASYRDNEAVTPAPARQRRRRCAPGPQAARNAMSTLDNQPYVDRCEKSGVQDDRDPGEAVDAVGHTISLMRQPPRRRRSAAALGALLALLLLAATASGARAGTWIQVSCVNPDGTAASSDGWTA